MTVALDTSALLALAVDGSQRQVVLDALATDPIWCASALALTEALPAIDRLTDAVHLAAAERLPRPVSFVTFDPAHIGVALAMGFDVVSS